MSQSGYHGHFISLNSDNGIFDEHGYRRRLPYNTYNSYNIDSQILLLAFSLVLNIEEDGGNHDYTDFLLNDNSIFDEIPVSIINTGPVGKQAEADFMFRGFRALKFLV